MKNWAVFGARVRDLRLAGGLSMKDFGGLIHYSKPQISRVERGLVRPTKAFAAACDRALGTGVELVHAAAVLEIEAQQSEGGAKTDLPAGPRRLIGRDTEVEMLTRHLKGFGDPRAPRVCVLHGMPGVGKTAIALWVAELMHTEFPDGRIYLDLQGYQLNHDPVGANEALDRALHRLGISGKLMPRFVEDRRALLRQKLASQRVLLILDNVRTAQQVIDLLPPNSQSAVVITSRRALNALEEAEHHKVNALAPRDAVELFHWVARLPPQSDERGDPVTVAEIAHICCGLPLALCIVASRLRDNPVRRLEDVAARLADQTARLRELDDGLRSMTAVFEAFSANLSETQRTMLSLIAIHPGSRVDTYAAGSLAEIAPAAADDLLDELIRVGMLERHSRNGYRLHDLLRDYLRRPQAGVLSPSKTVAARQRLFDYWLHTVAAADNKINEHRYRVPPQQPSSGVILQEFSNAARAKEWMNREVDNFLPVTREMSKLGSDGICWRFVYYLRGYFYATKQWELMIACYQSALESVDSQDHKVMAIVVNNLGLAHAQLGNRNEAARLFSQAQKEFSAAEDTYGEMNVIANQSWLAYDNEEYRSALELAQATRAFYLSRKQYANAAIALDCIARCELRLGLLTEAERDFNQAYKDFKALNFQDGDTAQLLSHLGETELRLGNWEQAAECYRQAVHFARSGTAVQEETVALEGLSRVTAAQAKTNQPVL